MKSSILKLCMVGVVLLNITLMAIALPAKAETGPNKIKADASKLYDSVTGKQFQPRGANYVRLARTPSGVTYHSSFEPGQYNLSAVRAFLAQIQHDQYNTVRVFIDHGSTDANNPHGIGRGMGTYDKVYGPYMDNVASFVNEAAARGIYVLPSMDMFPQNSYYWGLAGTHGDGFSSQNIDGRNLSYMERGRIFAKAEYMREFANALIERIGVQNKNAVLAYQSDNEVFFETNKAPFNQMSGAVKPFNGIIYDMSKPADRQNAADANLITYTHWLKNELVKADPDALMTIGFFTNSAVGKSGFNGLTTSYCSLNCNSTVDYRVPGRPYLVTVWGAADFIDMHMYPSTSSYNPSQSLAGMEENLFRKPYIIGEFGAKKSVYGNNVVTAAYAMRDFRIASCNEGAQGWLFWTWDTYENMASQDLFFKMTENKGAINGQLAPIAQPYACSASAVRRVAVPVALPPTWGWPAAPRTQPTQ